MLTSWLKPLRSSRLPSVPWLIDKLESFRVHLFSLNSASWNCFFGDFNTPTNSRTEAMPFFALCSLRYSGVISLIFASMIQISSNWQKCSFLQERNFFLNLLNLANKDILFYIPVTKVLPLAKWTVGWSEWIVIDFFIRGTSAPTATTDFHLCILNLIWKM